MKNKNISPTQRFFAKPEKPPIGSHTSGSTIQNSGHGLVKQTEIPNKISRAESQTIKVLRQDLRNIKQQVTKLIQEGFVKVPHSSDWLQSSGAISVSISKSKSSRSPFINNNFVMQPSNISNKKQLQFDFGNDQQIKNLKQQCEILRNLCKNKQKKQADLLAKQKQLQKQVKALKNCNQQMKKCIQILQTTLKQTNIQMKIMIQQKNQLSQQLQKNQLQLKQLNIRLSQQINFQKAENNQLVFIIQIKENQVQQLKKKYELQIKEMQLQYYHEIEEQRIMFRTQHQFQLQQHSRNIQIFRQNTFYADDYENMQVQIRGLKKQLANRQRVMLMMLNDIKNLQAELKVADTQHQQLIRCQKLIDSLNQTIVKINTKNLENKYTQCF